MHVHDLHTCTEKLRVTEVKCITVVLVVCFKGEDNLKHTYLLILVAVSCPKSPLAVN
jgi:hypothetical protein